MCCYLLSIHTLRRAIGIEVCLLSYISREMFNRSISTYRGRLCFRIKRPSPNKAPLHFAIHLIPRLGRNWTPFTLRLHNTSLMSTGLLSYFYQVHIGLNLRSGRATTGRDRKWFKMCYSFVQLCQTFQMSWKRLKSQKQSLAAFRLHNDSIPCRSSPAGMDLVSFSTVRVITELFWM